MSEENIARQYGKNAASGVVFLIVQGAIGFALIPFYMRSLGAEAYGVIQLSNALVNVMSLLSVGLTLSVSRHMTTALWRHGQREASGVFSNGLVAAALVGGACVLGMGIVGIRAGDLFRLSESTLAVARTFFVANGVFYAAGMIFAVLSSAAYAHGRVDVQNVVRFADLGVRSGVPVVAIMLGWRSLGAVTLGMLAGGTVVVLGGLIAWRKFGQGVLFFLQDVSLESMRPLLRTGSWVSVNQAGALLHLSADVTIISALLSTAVAGVYGALAQWPTFLRLIAHAIGGAAAPFVTRASARGDLTQAWNQSKFLVKLSGAVAAVGSGILIAAARPLVSAWLGGDYVGYAPVLQVLLVSLPVNLAVVPLFSFQTALDDVKWPAIVTLITGIVNVVISVALVRVQPLGIGVAFGTLVALTAKNLVYTPLRAAKIAGKPWWDVLRTMPTAILVSGVTFVAAQQAARLAQHVSNILAVLLAAATGAVIGGLAAWIVVFAGEDRARILRALGGMGSR